MLIAASTMSAIVLSCGWCQLVDVRKAAQGWLGIERRPRNEIECVWMEMSKRLQCERWRMNREKRIALLLVSKAAQGQQLSKRRLRNKIE